MRRLITRSERGQLTPQELADYQSLAQEAQQIDAMRVEALAILWPSVRADPCKP